MGALRRQSGQAAVELVAILPVLALAALIALQLALVGHGLWTSANASRAAARAEHVGGDARRAARSAIPSPLRGKLATSANPAHVRLRVPSLLPGVPPASVATRSSLPKASRG